ncbi:MAG TPA: alpha-1,2-fucosyltransferase [Puia sp.]|nr:alpha-1,2-fucosyltransferase [Puia sp.]
MSQLLEVKITDGLGNQLFQYAAGRSLAIKKGVRNFWLNIDSFKHNSLGREFGLRNFRTRGKVITNGLVEKILRKDTKYNRLISAFPFYKVISDNGLILQDLSQNNSLLLSLNGYWQSEYYFKDIRSVLLDELQPVEIPELPHWLLETETVAVHVRRTDYLTEKGIGCLGEKYYERAMGIIRERIKDPLFVFFSDDIPWCKQTFPQQRTVFCEQAPWDKDYLQLYLMSKCSHQIVANSSFSWWGAWLNRNPGKIILRAQTPFVDMSLFPKPHYYPEEWISVNSA